MTGSPGLLATGTDSPAEWQKVPCISAQADRVDALATMSRQAGGWGNPARPLPVIMLSSTWDRPAVTSPSAGSRAPGRTLRTSPRCSRAAGTSCSPITWPCAAGGRWRNRGVCQHEAPAGSWVLVMLRAVLLKHALASKPGPLPFPLACTHFAHLWICVAQDGGCGRQAQQLADG